MVTTALTLLVFYVGTRYRLPLVFPLAVFAGKTVDDVLSRWQKKQVAFAQLGAVVVALIVSWILCVVPMTERMHFVTALGYRNLGENYHTQAGNAVKGEAAYHKGLALFDASSGFGHTTLSLNAESELHVLLGNALLDQQKYDSAITSYRDARRIDQRMTDALSRLAFAYYTKATRQTSSGQAPSRALLDTARDYAGQYRNGDTLSVPANALLGDIYAARQNPDSALQIYRYMARLDTLNVPAIVATADIEFGQGDTGQAVTDLTRAAGIDSFNLVPIWKLGLAYGIRGDHAGVRALLGAAVDRVERNPRVLQAVLHSQAFSSYIDTKYYLAIAALNLQEWDLAVRQAEAILKMVPDHKPAQQLLQDAHNHKPPERPQ